MPKELGLPCWDTSNISLAITSTAKVDAAQKDYFLASHTPIEGITNDNTKEKYTEETFFEELFKESHGNVLSIVHGDPGTGKSHLIQWLKLRCEDKIERGELKDIVPILVQRRYGNLKDALEQIVEQLGSDFEQYISRISDAIGRISESEALVKFANEFYFELSPTQRGGPLRAELKDLPEAFRSPGFVDWLCREEGVVNRNVKRLTGESDIDEREVNVFPQFTESDFLYEPRSGDQNIEGLLSLFDELNDELDLREQAANLCNDALPNVIRQRTGLTDNGLMKVFDKIRADLKKQSRTLAIFIEDISVMSALDEEVYSAVEPRAQENLCRMVAVLGLTEQGRKSLSEKLAENRRQRITHPVSVGGQATDSWRKDISSVAKFSARYLNTVRLRPSEVRELAEKRRNQNDSIINACTKCLVRDTCHSVFGFEEIDGEKIGMFPFTKAAPQQLLSNLSEHATVRKNPRGLLTNILEPALSHGYEQLEQGQFPSLHLAVSLPPAVYWTAFEQNYCGGWKSSDKKRLKLLSEGWIHTQNADQAARRLKPLLKPLHFPDFSSVPSEEAKETPLEPESKPQDPQPILDPPDTAGIQRVLGNLQKWHDGNSLVGDSDIRDMLSRFFRESLPWNDELSPPLNVWKKLVQATGNKPFKIDGMLANPANVNYRFDFPRNKESLSLFESLLQYESRSGWNFPHSELYKRNIFGWLRRNAASQLRSIQPQAPLDPSLPVKIATQLLALLATIRRRRTLPVEPHKLDELVEEVLTDSAVAESIGLSSEWQKLLQNLIQRGPELRQFLVDETMVPQGRTGGANFINPLPIIEGVRDFVEQLHVDTLEDIYFTGHLTSRYHPLRAANMYSDLSSALSAEQKSIGAVTDEILFGLKALGLETVDPANAVIEFCTLIPALAKAVTSAAVFVTNTAKFDGLKTANVFVQRRDAWATALKNAVEVVNADNLEKILTYDTRNLVDLRDSMDIVADYVSRTEKETESLLVNSFPEGDPDVYFSELIETLRIIAGTNSEDGTSGSEYGKS